MKTRLEVILPVLQQSYGTGSMIEELAEDLDKKWDEFEKSHRGLEHEVFATCWVWFGGGDTAARTAKEVIAAVEENKK